ncbi:hypothetical protein MRB53_018861 [Persea americana]|uniref:Uncharacterized protein n=1 Tax=Persea americana TaxID=3435 RepID=A0ACC2MAJ0_PERAE|nr:hypothetical protein MRB53_018861 [Persea americana]
MVDQIGFEKNADRFEIMEKISFSLELLQKAQIRAGKLRGGFNAKSAAARLISFSKGKERKGKESTAHLSKACF